MSHDRLPDFVSIGAQKSATTWLYRCLAEHPGIFVGPKQRIAYFEPDVHARHDLAWYREFFRAARPDQLVGEFRVEYLSNEASPALIAATLPGCKLLVNLRDPAARALSAVRWNVRRGLLPGMSAEEAIVATLDDDLGGLTDAQAELLRGVITMGHYDEQLSRYRRHFDWDRFLVLVTDDIRVAPADNLRAVLRFLGADPDFTPTSLESTPLRSAGLPWLTRLERMTSGVAATFKIWEPANQLARRLGLGRQRPGLSVPTERRLRAAYAPHNARLRALLAEYVEHPATLADHLGLERYAWLREPSPAGSAGSD